MSQELTYSIKEMIEEFRVDTKDSLSRIETQTTKTNGRVTSLESTRVQVWTAISILLLLGSTIIYLSIKAIDVKIRDGIAQALEANVTTIQYDK